MNVRLTSLLVWETQKVQEGFFMTEQNLTSYLQNLNVR